MASITSDAARVADLARPERLTDGELDDCGSSPRRSEHVAARVLAKRLIFEELAVDPEQNPPWKAVEFHPDDRGKPEVELHGAVREAARREGIDAIQVSWSHTDHLVTAVITVE